MINIDEFLGECVYYPCSKLHGLPIELLGKRFQRYFYADYSVDREKLDERVEKNGFRGYQLSNIDEPSPESVFGASWRSIMQTYESTLPKLEFEWSDPFVVLFRFKRAAHFSEDHGPKSFELIFARCEAIAAFDLVFSRRNITPKCLVHIRPGLAFGGAYADYPQMLSRALLKNKAGLPTFLLYDRLGGSSDNPGYLNVIEKYHPIEQFSHHSRDPLTLAKLVALDGQHDKI